jgi:L-alanine-DL-glutamate epimerase-like enolase superfamily enzyme
VPWFYTDQWKTVSDALETPTCTGEDIYLLKNGFKPLLDARAVDIIQPDLATSGGLSRNKTYRDYAEECGVAMAMHMAGTPVTFMANVHCAASYTEFSCTRTSQRRFTMVGKPRKDDRLPADGHKWLCQWPLDSRALVLINEEEVKKHLHPGKRVFRTHTEWDDKRSHDRLWS